MMPSMIVEQHVGEVGALLGAHVQVRLGQARHTAERELDAAGEAHQSVRLDDADLNDRVGVDEAAADRKRAEEATVRRGQFGDIGVGDDELDLLLRADGGDAARAVGAPHERRCAGAAGTVGDERLRAARLERAEHDTQCLRVSRDGARGRGAAEHIDLDGDTFAGGGERLPAPEGGDQALNGRRQAGAVLRGHMGDERRRARRCLGVSRRQRPDDSAEASAVRTCQSRRGAVT
jgi:hypothetical protein